MSMQMSPAASMGLEDNVYNRLLRERIIFLGTEVKDENANAICAQLLLLAAEDHLLPIRSALIGAEDELLIADAEDPRTRARHHPDTGQANLLIGRHAYGIVGMDPRSG